jgi:DNA-binding CsgD family transcriptional regulator
MPRRRKSNPTKKEMDILLDMANYGCTAKELAKRRGNSHRTIEHHIGNLYVKFDVHKMSQAIKFAVNRGLIHYHKPLDLYIANSNFEYMDIETRGNNAQQNNKQ